MRPAFVLHGRGCDIIIAEVTRSLAFGEGFVSDDLTKALTRCAGEAGRKLADADTVMTTRGPGSFTAIRTALATAQGIAFALGKPVFAPTRFEVLAYASRNDTTPALLTAATFRGDYVCQRAEGGRLIAEPYTAAADAITSIAGHRLMGDLDPQPQNEAALLTEFYEAVMHDNGTQDLEAYHTCEPYYVVPLPYRPAAG